MTEKMTEPMLPRAPRVVSAVARVSFKEVLRDKILYNVVMVAVLLLGVGFLASRLTFVRPERILIDFGVSSIAISCAILAIFFGAAQIGREFERRTVFVALSRPISRLQFLLGKYVGLGLVLSVNWALLCAMLVGILLLSGAGMDTALNSTLLWAFVGILLQTFLLEALAFLISSFSTLSISAMITIGLYLIGNNISQLRALAERADAPFRQLLLLLSGGLPNLEHFNLGARVTYALPVDWRFGTVGVVYAAVWIVFCLWSAGFLLERRES